MIATILHVAKTPLLPRADGKGGVFDIRGISVDGHWTNADAYSENVRKWAE